MLKIFSIIFFCIFSSSVFSQSLEIQKLHSQILNNSVKLTCLNKLNSYGSGTIIQSIKENNKTKILILSVAHFSGDCKEMIVTIVEYQDYFKTYLINGLGKIIIVDKELDLSLIEMNSENIKPYLMSKIMPEGNKLYSGEEVIEGAAPGNRLPILTKGILNYYKVNDRIIVASINSFFGSSGGGLYHKNNEENYELIGVMQGIYGNNRGLATFISEFISYDKIYQFLKENKYEYILKN